MRFNVRPHLSNKTVFAMLLTLSTADSYAIVAQGDRLDEGAGSGEPTAAMTAAPAATPHTLRSPATRQEPSGVNRYADQMGLP